MHAFAQSSRDLLIGGMVCLFTGQLVWFLAGGMYNALCCLARNQSPLAWLRQITFVHLHALLPPVHNKGRISPAALKHRYPSAPWWYRAATLGMLAEGIGLLVVLGALILELLLRLGQPGHLPDFSGM